MVLDELTSVIEVNIHFSSLNAVDDVPDHLGNLQRCEVVVIFAGVVSIDSDRGEQIRHACVLRKCTCLFAGKSVWTVMIGGSGCVLD